MIPVFKPDIPSTGSLKKLFREIDKSSHFTNFGPKSMHLEQEVSNIFKMSEVNVVSVCNATLAIEGALICEKESDKWTVPSWTFVAPALSLSRARKSFEFVDVDSNWRTFGISTEQNNDAILDVLPFGDEIDIKRFEQFNGTILIDAAGSFDSLKNFTFPNDKRVGIVMSFHATKSMPGAEGGAFISNDSEWVSRVRKWSNFGFGDTRSSESVGTNAKMHEYSAAIILGSLSRWRKDNVVWKETNSWAYNLSNELGVTTNPALAKAIITPYWIIRNLPEVTLKLEKFLEKNEIQTRRWWGFGCHKMKVFEDVKIDPMGLKNTNDIAYETLGLPMYKNMSISEKQKITSVLKVFYDNL
jgi:dTDP-4-amino-4,6-dideoxygalactose transaminase